MKQPSLLIVTDHNALIAYLLQPDDLPIVLKHVDFICDGQTGVALTACHPEWKEHEISRVIALKIDEILDRYDPENWGLAAPPPLCDEISDQLRHCHEKRLCMKLSRSVSDIHVGNVTALFSAAASEPAHA